MYIYDNFDRTLLAERVTEFRDQVARRLSGELTEDEFKPLRLMNGVYLQLHAYMLRVAIPYGSLGSDQLRMLAHVGTRDATNSFKAYSTEFVRQVGIDSRDGFEIGIELTAKAKRLRLPVAEIPTIWLDRQAGMSKFKLAQWIPHYLRWWAFAFGPPLTEQDLKTRFHESRLP